MGDPQFDEIEELKEEWLLDEALDLANSLLAKNPKNKDALYQVADIMYRKGEIWKAEKPINFLLDQENDDAMSWYIKWVLEMEKTNRQEAKKYMKKAIWLLDDDNPEMIRCLAICEFWSWNREWWMRNLKQAFEMSKFDAEIILNLIELHILQHQWNHASQYITYYNQHHEQLQFFDKPKSYYDEKIMLFKEYISYQLDLKVNKKKNKNNKDSKDNKDNKDK